MAWKSFYGSHLSGLRGFDVSKYLGPIMKSCMRNRSKISRIVFPTAFSESPFFHSCPITISKSSAICIEWGGMVFFHVDGRLERLPMQQCSLLCYQRSWHPLVDPCGRGHFFVCRNNSRIQAGKRRIKDQHLFSFSFFFPRHST